MKHLIGKLPAWLQNWISRYIADDASMRASALAYNLLFSVFPILILINNIIGLLHIDGEMLIESVRTFLPPDVITFLMNYLEYAANTTSMTLVVFSIVFSVYFPFRTIGMLMDTIRTAFRKSDEQKPRFYLLRQLGCSILLPITLFISLVLIVLGKNVIEYAMSLLPFLSSEISEAALSLWQPLRFVAAALLMSVSLGVVYKASLNRKLSVKKILPGTLWAIVAWLIASMLFSFYTENFANYSIIYGALGAVVVTLLWLYLTGTVLIMGAELNAVLLEREEEKQEQKPNE